MAGFALTLEEQCVQCVQLLCNPRGSEVRELCRSFVAGKPANLDARCSYKNLAERGGIRTPGTSFSSYNGLANSRFHTLLFGINRLRSDELPHCGAKSPCSRAIVQLMCNRESICTHRRSSTPPRAAAARSLSSSVASGSLLRRARSK